MDNNKIQEITRSILEKGSFISLATHDDGGVWVCGLLYVLDANYNIYWKSDESVRHSRAIHTNPEVAATIIISAKPGDPSEAVQISGVATKVDTVPDETREHYLTKRNKRSEDDTNLPDDTWYRLTPQEIRLSYQPLFGYEKQDASL